MLALSIIEFILLISRLIFIPLSFFTQLFISPSMNGYAYVVNVLTMKAQGFKLDKITNEVEKIDCIQF